LNVHDGLIDLVAYYANEPNGDSAVGEQRYTWKYRDTTQTGFTNQAEVTVVCSAPPDPSTLSYVALTYSATSQQIRIWGAGTGGLVLPFDSSTYTLQP
jgi:hypothetical protein